MQPRQSGQRTSKKLVDHQEISSQDPERWVLNFNNYFLRLFFFVLFLFFFGFFCPQKPPRQNCCKMLREKHPISGQELSFCTWVGLGFELPLSKRMQWWWFMLFQEPGKTCFHRSLRLQWQESVTASSMQGTFKTALAGGGNLNHRRLRDKRGEKKILVAGFHLVHLQHFWLSVTARILYLFQLCY